MGGKAENQINRISPASFMPAPSGILQRACACGNHSSSGECAECAKKKGLLQRKTQHSVLGTRERESIPSIVHDVLRSPGQPLDSATRAFFEPRMGHDFSGVRVHTDARAAESAGAVNALAYTSGKNVVFGQGQYAPQSFEGRRLLGHELCHVVQQKKGILDESQGLKILGGSSLENEASQTSEQIVHGGQAHTLSASPAVLSRQAVTPSVRPALPAAERRNNVGRGGGRFDAVLNRAACLLTATMKVLFRFVDVPSAWPSEDTKTTWRSRFIERVTDRWSGRYDLAPSTTPCSGESCERLSVLMRVVPVTSNPHFTISVGYTTSFRTSFVSGRTATLDVLDVRRRRDISQVPAEHEFGHMLGLPHVHCDRNDNVCYGVTDQEQANIMGKGSDVSEGDYRVFTEVAELFSRCGWRPVPTQSAVGRVLLGGGIGALVGAGVGAILGPIGALIGGLIGAAAGGLIGALV